MARIFRSGSTIVGSAKATLRQEESVYEHFVVVGAGADGESIDILFHYPTDVPLQYGDELLAFCLPFGLDSNRVRRSNSMSQVHELMFGQLSALETTARSFVFMLNTGAKLVYGVCVLSDALNSALPSFIRPFHKAFEMEAHVSSTRCYCLLSAHPFFDAHFDVLYALLANERLHNLQAMNQQPSPRKDAKPLIRQATGSRLRTRHLSNHAKFKLLRNSSESLVGMGDIPEEEESAVKVVEPEDEKEDENDYGMSMCDRAKFTPSLDLLRKYHLVSIPSLHQTTEVELTTEPVPCNISLPSGSAQELIGFWALPCLFRLLSLQDFLHFYTAVLLEVPIVVISRNPGILSSVVLSIIPLLAPMVWQGPLIPVLPTALEECLDSPVPLIAGLYEMPQNRSGWNDPLIVDLNANKLHLPSRKMESLPDKKKLISEIKSHYSVLRVVEQDNSGSTLSVGSTSANSVLKRSTGSSVSVFKRCKEEEVLAVTHIVRAVMANNENRVLGPNVDAALRQEAAGAKREDTFEDIVKNAPKQHQAFMRQLVATQQFYMHAARRKEVLDQQLAVREDTVKQLERNIKTAARRANKLESLIASYQEQLTAVRDEIAQYEECRANILREDKPLKRSKPTRSHKRTKSWLS
mmetsp:Transcript_21107/g.81926  ORF Transcript_21107/g.81926 Transcript_21107/m.81926 type:complete len:637 (-) Transcript_21107:41-1951(-)